MAAKTVRTTWFRVELSGLWGPIIDRVSELKGYGAALLVCLAVTLAAILLLPYLDHVNLVMLFLLAVVGVAAGYGRGPAVFRFGLGRRSRKKCPSSTGGPPAQDRAVHGWRADDPVQRHHAAADGYRLGIR
jgi:nitrate/nitrite transporter NarK